MPTQFDSFKLNYSLLFVSFLLATKCVAEEKQSSECLRIIEKISSDAVPKIRRAYYSHSTGLEMLGPAGISTDAGKTWKQFQPKAVYTVPKLPYGYRREPFPGVLDPSTGKIVTIINAMDTAGLDPKIVEPPVSFNTYYLRYRVSTDAGHTELFDEPIVQTDHTLENPFEGIYKGKNGILLGDLGCVPIFTRDGTLLVPTSTFLLGEDGRLVNPGGGYTYEDVLVLIGKWGRDERLIWEVSQRVQGDPKRTTRGLSEATLAEFLDGRVLMVMRGSNGGTNDPKFELPSHKWFSISTDKGHSWSKPKPWSYESGKPFFSPSSMSQLLVHSTGRVFWIGNINTTNSKANDRRWPLVIGEVDSNSLQLIESSILILDTRNPNDPTQLDISHFWAIEDRLTGDVLISAPRFLDGYKSEKWTLFRIGL